MYESLTPNIMVPDVNQTVQWYQDNLNFELANQVGSLEDKLEWAVVQAGDVQIFFQQIDSLVKEIPALKDKVIGDSLTFYIKVDDVQKLFSSLQGKVEIVLEMKTTFYGAQEFGIKDCNGYILVFSEMKE